MAIIFLQLTRINPRAKQNKVVQSGHKAREQCAKQYRYIFIRNIQLEV